MEDSLKMGVPSKSSGRSSRSFSFPRLVRQFYRVASTYFAGDAKWQARGLMAMVILLACGGTGMHVVISYTRKDFANALTEKNEAEFYTVVLKFAGIIAFAAPFLAVAEYVEGKMVLEWRLWLTNLLLGKYFANRSFFNLKLEGVLDNPDQRICEDVGNFVNSSVAVIKMLVEKVMSIFAFSAVLWSISPSVVAFLLTYALLGTVITLQLFGKKLMQLKFEGLQKEADLRYSLVRVRDNVESIAFYRGELSELSAVKGYLRRLAENILRRLSWNFLLNVFTNGYRFATFLIPGLVLAPRLFRGEVRYGDVVQTAMAFGEIFRAVTVIVLKFDLLSSLAAETERLESLLTALGLAPGSQSRDHYFPAPTSSRFLSCVVNSIARLGAFVGSATVVPKARKIEPLHPKKEKDSSDDESNRLRPKEADGRMKLMEAYADEERLPFIPLVAPDLSLQTSNGSCEEAASKGNDGQCKEAQHQVVRAVNDWLAVTGLRIMLPRSGKELFPSPLSFELKQCHSLLVMGPSGCGKSSLLRVISGLWTQGQGKIQCPDEEDIFFLPQKPYMPLGSLREQLLFPHNRKVEEKATDVELLKVLKLVSLPDLASKFPAGLDEDCDWSATLSTGEQQRVAFARLLLHQPTIAFLDEATSAVDTTNEGLLYKALANHVSSFVSVGHRLSLVQYHSYVLWFDAENQTWNFTASEDFKRQHALSVQVD